jgi:hypothetical protein
MSGKTLKPSTRGLFESVERFKEATNICGMLRIDEAGRLLTIDHLIEISMEESVFDIELVNRPVVGEGEGEDNADGGRFNDRTEGFVKIDAGLL